MAGGARRWRAGWWRMATSIARTGREAREQRKELSELANRCGLCAVKARSDAGERRRVPFKRSGGGHVTAAGSVPPEAVAVQRAGAALSHQRGASDDQGRRRRRRRGEAPAAGGLPPQFRFPVRNPSSGLGDGHVSAVIATSRLNCAGSERSPARGGPRYRCDASAAASPPARKFFFFCHFPRFRDVTDTCDCLRRHRQQLRIGGAYWSRRILAVACGLCLEPYTLFFITPSRRTKLWVNIGK